MVQMVQLRSVPSGSDSCMDLSLVLLRGIVSCGTLYMKGEIVDLGAKERISIV